MVTDSEYIVTEIREWNTKKKLVNITVSGSERVYEVILPLYNSELRQFALQEGKAVCEETFRQIMDEVLVQRAKNRALHIITKQDVSEYTMRKKLADNYYPDEVIQKVIAFMKEHRFIDDSRFAAAYISCKADVKSRRQMEAYLSGKGISQDIIRQACEAFYAENVEAENVLARKLIQKKYGEDTESFTYEQKGKIFSYLARKGFSYDTIQQITGCN